MEELIELVEVVTKNKIKRIDVLGNSTNNSSNLQKMYEGIVSGELREEEVAKAHFYGDAAHKDMYFGRLKRNLFRRLINTLFFIDVNQPEFNDLQRAYYTCYREFAATKMLIGRGARKAGIIVAEKLLKRAIEFEFTNLVVEISRLLRVHFGSIVGNRKKFLEYNELYKKYLIVFQAESLAEEYYVDLATYFANSAAAKDEIGGIAKVYSDELKAVEMPFRTREFDFVAYYVHTLRYEVMSDYENMLRVCEEAVTLFETQHLKAQETIIFTFRLKMLACHVQLKRYQEGEETVQTCLKMNVGGIINLFGLYHYYMILLFHSEQWQKAFTVFQEATAHPNFKRLPDNVMEQWRIYEAFIQFFISLKKIKLEEKTESPKNFRVSKFLNEMPTYSKDKRGNNITLLILQVLFLLQRKQFDAVIDRMESLNVYCHRYLRKDATFRSNCFIKMLMILPQAHFNRTAAIRKTAKMRSRLNEVPLEVANQSSELEIVPYEQLWKLVLETLDDKFHRV